MEEKYENNILKSSPLCTFEDKNLPSLSENGESASDVDDKEPAQTTTRTVLTVKGPRCLRVYYDKSSINPFKFLLLARAPGSIRTVYGFCHQYGGTEYMPMMIMDMIRVVCNMILRIQRSGARRRRSRAPKIAPK